MISLSEIEVVAEKGIVQDGRYFGRSSALGRPSKRQLTLIEREQIEEHADALGVPVFEPGVVRSNLETEGIKLVPLAGQVLQIGTARVRVGAPRDPCEKMDRIAPGLRALMDHGRQGVLGQIVASGVIRVGDEIRVLSEQA